MKTMNLESLQSKVDKLHANSEGMGFSVDFVKLSNGQVTAKLKNFDEKYSAYNEIIISLIQLILVEGTKIVVEMLQSVNYYDDVDRKKKELDKILDERLKIFLTILYERGVEAFWSVLNTQVNLMQAKLCIESIVLDTENWIQEINNIKIPIENAQISNLLESADANYIRDYKQNLVIKELEAKIH